MKVWGMGWGADKVECSGEAEVRWLTATSLRNDGRGADEWWRARVRACTLMRACGRAEAMHASRARPH